MPAALASREEIVDRLFAVFRERGFDGASLSDLSRATGLGKSSLYHYFPEGKTQMAQAVLEKAQATIDGAILQTARSREPLKMRVRKIAAALDQFYAGGRTPCVLGQLSTGEIGAAARRNLRGAFADWIAAFELLAAESGMTRAAARAYAQDLVARLQGALILQAAGGDVAPFRRALDSLLDLARGGRD